jgi:hypothetical protein
MSTEPIGAQKTVVYAMGAFAIAGAIATFIGCQPPPIAYMATQTGMSPPRAKDATCDFAVTSIIPSGPYAEVGTLTFGSKTLSSYRASRDPEEFKQAVRGDVCQLGGDVVVTQVDYQGTIVRGTVLRRIEQ